MEAFIRRKSKFHFYYIHKSCMYIYLYTLSVVPNVEGDKIDSVRFGQFTEEKEF